MYKKHYENLLIAIKLDNFGKKQHLMILDKEKLSYMDLEDYYFYVFNSKFLNYYKDKFLTDLQIQEKAQNYNFLKSLYHLKIKKLIKIINDLGFEELSILNDELNLNLLEYNEIYYKLIKLSINNTNEIYKYILGKND